MNLNALKCVWHSILGSTADTQTFWQTDTPLNNLWLLCLQKSSILSVRIGLSRGKLLKFFRQAALLKLRSKNMWSWKRLVTYIRLTALSSVLSRFSWKPNHVLNSPLFLPISSWVTFGWTIWIGLDKETKSALIKSRLSSKRWRPNGLSSISNTSLQLKLKLYKLRNNNKTSKINNLHQMTLISRLN